MSYPRFIALLLALITLVAYLPATQNGFVYYDDDDYVFANNVVQAGLTFSGTRWAFTTDHASNWHPVTWLSHMTDCWLFGLNPAAHHLTNVLFHTANTVLLFAWLLRLTKKLWPAAIVAALFAWHPVHVESVAWVAERKDVLSTFFGLLSLLAFERFVRESKSPGSKTKIFFATSLACFALGLMAKPMLVTLPFLLLLLDFWPRQRLGKDAFDFTDIKRCVLEKIPFFLLAAASCIITLQAQHSAIATLESMPPAYRLANAAMSVFRYLSNIAWPTNLGIAYPMVQLSAPLAICAIGMLVVISLIVWHQRRSRPYLLVGWFWYIGTLVPVIGLVQVGSTAMADRYTYIPSIGIFLAVVFSLEHLAANARFKKIILAMTALGLVGAVIAMENQLRFWRDSETLFRHAIAVTENNDVAHGALGYTYQQQGRFTEALAEYQTTLKINPAHHQVRFSIGEMLLQLERPTEALVEFRRCLQKDPEIPALHNAAGRALAAQGDFAGAMTELAEAQRLDPSYPAPHLELANIYAQLDQPTNATAEIWVAVKTAPYDIRTLSAASRFLSTSKNAALRDGENALVLALKAQELASLPQMEVLDVMSMAFAETGDFSNAVTSAQNALELAKAAQSKTADEIRQRLAAYQTHQPWRESFQTTNAAVKP